MGQVYIPEVNWLLFIGSVAIVAIMQTSTKIGKQRFQREGGATLWGHVGRRWGGRGALLGPWPRGAAARLGADRSRILHGCRQCVRSRR